jgi:hypothetical protein
VLGNDPDVKFCPDNPPVEGTSHCHGNIKGLQAEGAKKIFKQFADKVDLFWICAPGELRKLTLADLAKIKPAVRLPPLPKPSETVEELASKVHRE